MKRPNFFIVGAAKSGTTSMWQYLCQHPNVFMPPSFLRKEPAFFSDLYGFDSREKYRAIFLEASDQHWAVGEASTAYLTDPVSAKRIAEVVPHAKIIIMLRNPVDRAYSLYNWMTQEGYEYAASFERALTLEDRRANSSNFKNNNPQYFYNYLYFRSGLYAEQVSRYIDRFSADQICVILFEEFIRDPSASYRRVCEFLNVDPDFEPNFKVYNKSRDVVFPPLQRILRKATNFTNRILRRAPDTKKDRDFLLSLGLRSRRRPKLSDELRAQLMLDYQSDIEKLECLIERDLSLWYE